MCHSVACGELHQTQPIAMGIKPHGLGINGDDRAKREPIGQVVAIEVHGAGRYELRNNAQCDGAQEKTRTSTASRPQVPETCASTNSATWAQCPSLCRSARENRLAGACSSVNRVRIGRG